MEKLVKSGPVKCEKVTQDVYKQVVATCWVGGMDLGEAMVLKGYAWAFGKYSDIYVEKEKLAKLNRVGVLQGPAQPAWDYRAQRRLPVAQKAPDGCVIKGNISKNGKIYHAPSSRWYGRTKITPSKGEHWFCSAAEAVAVGWRPPRQ
jgi:hypothetical protein